MTKERLIELFELVKQRLTDGYTFENGNPIIIYGICGVIVDLNWFNIINPDEKEYIIHYLRKNKPSLINDYSNFMETPHWINRSYWWGNMHEFPETKQIRIDYLNKLISNIK